MNALSGDSGVMDQTKDEIWLQLHLLSNALEDAGPSRAERLSFAIQEFLQMPQTVRGEMVRELHAVAADLLDLESLVIADPNNIESTHSGWAAT